MGNYLNYIQKRPRPQPETREAAGQCGKEGFGRKKSQYEADVFLENLPDEIMVAVNFSTVSGEIVTLICTVEDVPEPNALLLTTRDLVQHVEKREYFRRPADRLSVAWYRKSERKKNRQKLGAKGINIT